MARAPVIAALLFALGCEASAGAAHGPVWLDSPLAAFPEALSAVGLYPDMSDPAQVDARAQAYAPEFALWSNGGAKARYLVLPEGAAIEVSGDDWSFPAGTLLFKTFAFATEDGGAVHPVETRVLRATERGWDYATYLWDDAGDGGNARLLDGRHAARVAVVQDGERFEHEVPNTRQCRQCHEGSPARVLGFNAWQLDHADAKAGSDTTLERLAHAGAFERTPRGRRIAEPDAETRWVKGYVAANCTHCHNGGSGPNNAFDLRPDVFEQNTLEHETESSASGVGVRIAPGDAGRSVLYLGFTDQDNGTGIKAMPPVGVQRRDRDAAERLQRWIDAL